MISNEDVLKALEGVLEPDLNKDIVSLGLVEDIKIDGNNISFTVRTSNPAMHSKQRMKEACEFAIERNLGADTNCTVNIQPIKKEDSNDPSLRKVLPGVKNIIAVASGKGGVGKSTVAANLAVGLVNKGFKVGMIDADVYGPSMPTMLDVVHDKPGVIDHNGKRLMTPVETYGLSLMSIGFFADPEQPIVWRGAMATKALNQMVNDTYWGELDYMIIDLPPGTGDVHLSIVQLLPLTGAVVVSTPQEVALADARKGVAMFKLDNIKVPVLGIIENMAWFTPEELPENKYYIFGRDGAASLSEQINVPLLGQIPLVQSIREAGDVGRPAVLQQSTAVNELWNELISNFETQVELRNKTLPPSQKVEITRT